MTIYCRVDSRRDQFEGKQRTYTLSEVIETVCKGVLNAEGQGNSDQGTESK